MRFVYKYHHFIILCYWTLVLHFVICGIQNDWWRKNVSVVDLWPPNFHYSIPNGHFVLNASTFPPSSVSEDSPSPGQDKEIHRMHWGRNNRDCGQNTGATADFSRASVWGAPARCAAPQRDSHVMQWVGYTCSQFLLNMSSSRQEDAVGGGGGMKRQWGFTSLVLQPTGSLRN